MIKDDSNPNLGQISYISNSSHKINWSCRQFDRHQIVLINSIPMDSLLILALFKYLFSVLPSLDTITSIKNGPMV